MTNKESFILTLVLTLAKAQKMQPASTLDNLTPGECEFWPYYDDEMLHPLLLGYEAAYPPPDNTTYVNVTAEIVDVGGLSDVDQTLSVTLALIMTYEDYRLKYPEKCIEHDNITEEMEAPLILHDLSMMAGLIWAPNIHVQRLHSAEKKKLFFDYSSASFYQRSHRIVIYSFFDIKVKCLLQFSRFPFDSQQCLLAFNHINLSSKKKPLLSGVKNNDNPKVSLRWGNKVSLNKDHEISSIINSKNGGNQEDVSGNWRQSIIQMWPKNGDEKMSRLEIVFEFERYRTSHVLQTFLPSLLLVSASMMSLWVPSGLVPGRMALAVTTTLTLMSMINSVFAEAPRTSYIKAIDLWLISSFGFTFLALMEYCVVLYLVKDADWYDSEKTFKHKVSQRQKRKMKIAFVVEKWCGIFLPLSYVLFVVIFAIYYYPSHTFKYNTEYFDPVSIETGE